MWNERFEIRAAFTSAAASDDRFVTTIVQVALWSTTTVVGLTVFLTARSPSGGAGGWVERAAPAAAPVVVRSAEASSWCS